MEHNFLIISEVSLEVGLHAAKFHSLSIHSQLVPKHVCDHLQCQFGLELGIPPTTQESAGHGVMRVHINSPDVEGTVFQTF